MERDQLTVLVQRLGHTQLYVPSPEDVVEIGTDVLERLIPHRNPFRFVDQVTALNRSKQCIAGRRLVDPTDPIFAGHFPNDPVFPGVLQIEAMGQLGLCLSYLSAPEPLEGNVRALRIHHAAFVAPVLPGRTMSIFATIVEQDELTATMAGQIFDGPTLCSFSIQEVCFV